MQACSQHNSPLSSPAVGRDNGLEPLYTMLVSCVTVSQRRYI